MFPLCRKDRGSNLRGVILWRTGQWLPGLQQAPEVGCSVGVTTKRQHEEVFGGDGTVLYLERGGRYANLDT